MYTESEMQLFDTDQQFTYDDQELPNETPTQNTRLAALLSNFSLKSRFIYKPTGFYFPLHVSYTSRFFSENI